ncbi:MAG: cytochrome c biogenesis protein CcdA [Gammaproteobacteria bacterium]|nr:cytochrome c biogenesis protein CcdA [Gammaproteobacteria bacterium]
MITYFWAYVAGILTLINPCVLPLLPIIIAGAFQASHWGPLALAGGLTLSFTVVGVGVTAFGHLLGIDDSVINQSAAVIMLVFGIILLIPKAQMVLSAAASPFAGAANERIDAVQSSGVAGQFLVGVLLGAVWSPCIGPTLGGAIGLAASGEGLGQATVTMILFGLGISTILVALSYGSRELVVSRRQMLMRWMPHAKLIMGLALIVVSIAILTKMDKPIESWLLDLMPVWLQDLSIRF